MNSRLSFFLAIAFLPASIAPIAFAEESPVAFHLVSKGVFRGGRPSSEEEMDFLENKGIHSIINLQGSALFLIPGESRKAIQRESEQASRRGIRYFHLPISTLKELNSDEVARLLEAVRIMTDPHLQPVYVHCNIGADRTGVMVAAYRILGQNCSFEKAWSELKDYGVVWTPIFSDPQSDLLRDLAANPSKYGFARSAEKCPL